ncbi:SRPBCC family protein [Curtobacterium sp. MMLR14_010]|uniref:SRPBCC family protein n=1 Tax=Curtobacterium sp. MMLR14_010 TaxID=1898743 RepID=UPI0009F327E2
MQGDFEAIADSALSPSEIWEYLIDARSWPRWGTVDELVIAQSAGLSPDGHDKVGAVRAFRTGKITTSERIIELRPGRLFVYGDAVNPVMSDYRAEIQLSPVANGGTLITWSGRYTTPFPTGLFLRPFLRRTMRKMVHGLAAAPHR